jgi:PDZ domain-containing protein
MPRVSATGQLKLNSAPSATAIVRNVRRPYAKGAAAGVALAALAGVTLLLLAAATPSDDYLFLPSPAQPVAPVVKVAGESADPAPSGPGFLFTAVAQRRASRLESWLPFLREDHAELVPMRALIPPGGTPQEQDQVDRAAMTDSQLTAAAVAERALGKPVEVTTRGVRVNDTAVPGGSPARSAGLQSGDVITAVDGKPVTTLAQLRQLLATLKAGQVVAISYLRGGKPQTARVALRASPDADDNGRPILGIGATDDVDITLPVPVSYSIGDVEGPSAGLAFALEVYSAPDRAEAGRRPPRGRHRRARDRRERAADRRRGAEGDRRRGVGRRGVPGADGEPRGGSRRSSEVAAGDPGEELLRRRRAAREAAAGGGEMSRKLRGRAHLPMVLAARGRYLVPGSRWRAPRRLRSTRRPCGRTRDLGPCTHL